MDPLGQKLLPHLEAHALRLKEHNKRVLREAQEFSSFDPRTLADMSPSELSAFQSSFLPSSAQFIVAAHEWNNRLVTEQIRAINAHSRSGTRTALMAGFGGLFLGLVMTTLKDYYFPTTIQMQLPNQESSDHRPDKDQSNPEINTPPPK